MLDIETSNGVTDRNNTPVGRIVAHWLRAANLTPAEADVARQGVAGACVRCAMAARAPMDEQTARRGGFGPAEAEALALGLQPRL